jgi:siroheme synthase (precorrin-2 oxidase/ferrochelatase)
VGRKKISTTIYLEPWQQAALQEVSKSSGVSQAKLIRDAIDGLLEDRLEPEVFAKYRQTGMSEMDQMRKRLRELEERLARSGR